MNMNKSKIFYAIDKFDNKLDKWIPIKTFPTRTEAVRCIYDDVGKDNHIPFRIRKEKDE